MAEPAPRTDADHGTPPRMPRWVKIVALLVGLLIVLFAIVQLTGIGGEHGPGRHVSGATTADAGTPAAAPALPAAVLG